MNCQCPFQQKFLSVLSYFSLNCIENLQNKWTIIYQSMLITLLSLKNRSVLPKSWIQMTVVECILKEEAVLSVVYPIIKVNFVETNIFGSFIKRLSTFSLI